jgi:hypothetical protein
VDRHTQLLVSARQRLFSRLDLMSTPSPLPEVAPEPTGPLAWLDAAPVTCDFCRKTVRYDATKVERENLDYGDQPVYYGMATSIEVRVCSHH